MPDEERPLPEEVERPEDEEAAGEFMPPPPAAPARMPPPAAAPPSRDLFGGLLAMFGKPAELPDRGLLPRRRRRRRKHRRRDE